MSTDFSAVMAEIQSQWPGQRVDEMAWRRTFLGLPADAVVLAVRNAGPAVPPDPKDLLLEAREHTKLLARPSRRDPRGETVACRQCMDEQWVEIADDLNRSVKPCMACQPLVYNRWAGGHFGSGHRDGGCPQCP